MDNDRLNASSAPPSLPTAVAVRSFLEQRFVRETGQSLRYAIPSLETAAATALSAGRYSGGNATSSGDRHRHFEALRHILEDVLAEVG